MEVTLLIEAMDTSFSLLEDARKKADELLYTAAKLTEETKTIEDKRVQALLHSKKKEKSSLQNFLVSFMILFAFWIILSGKFDLFHLSLGIICTFAIALTGHNLLFTNIRVGDIRLTIFRFIGYIPWLIYEILVANIQVAAIVLSPRLSITPGLIWFKTKLQSDISWVVLANSITLTPGTITVDVRDGEFCVHALSEKFSEGLLEGRMEDRVAHIFMEADHIYVQDVLDVAPIFGKLRKTLKGM